MPVGSSCRCPDQISRLDAAGLGAFVTDPTGTRHNFQELSVLVGVPVVTCAGGECHVGDDDSVLHVDQVEVDIAGKCGSGLDALTDLGGAGDDN